MINLNLLTQADKKNVKIELAFFIVKDVVFLLFVVVAAVAMLFVLSNMILKNNYQEFIRASQLVDRQDSESQRLVSSINQETLGLSQIQQSWIPVHGFVSAIVSLFQKSDASLSMIRYSAQTHALVISGFAPTRAEVLALQQSLSAQPFVQELHSPLANILKPQDVEFSFEMILKNP